MEMLKMSKTKRIKLESKEEPAQDLKLQTHPDNKTVCDPPLENHLGTANLGLININQVGAPEAPIKEETIEAQVPLSNMKFENIFYNPETQKSAWDMLLKGKMKLMKSSLSGNFNPFSSGCQSRGSLEVKSTDSDAILSLNSSTGSTGGVNMVNELMSRYETNWRKKRVEEAKKLLDDDGEEELDDYERLWNEGESTATGKSHFLKYTVPQYELKNMLLQIHYESIEGMSLTAVETVLSDVLPQLQQIMNEDIHIERHNVFKSCGISKKKLAEMTVSRPFSSYQEQQIISIIDNKLFSTLNVNGLLLNYMTHVLLPEALIRIYAKVNDIPLEHAEKELRYEEGYDGYLNKQLIEKLKKYEEAKIGH